MTELDTPTFDYKPQIPKTPTFQESKILINHPLSLSPICYNHVFEKFSPYRLPSVRVETIRQCDTLCRDPCAPLWDWSIRWDARDTES